MRTAFADEMTKLAATDERIVLLVGDIGNSLFNEFREKYPTRFYNCGIAEQNMVSMAAGMAASGFRPVCFTIAPFLTARCFEQIKIDLGYHNVPVVLAGVGAGLCYANLGPTHQALDDIAILRTVPNLKIAVPCDKQEARACLRTCLQEDGPTYLRLGRDGEPEVTTSLDWSGFGHWRFLQTGRSGDVIVLACGPVAAACLPSEWDVVSCASVRPLESKGLQCLKGWRLVVTVEEHGVTGGFGSAVAEWMADNRVTARLLRIGCPDEFLKSPMTPDEARDYCGLTAEKITQRIQAELAKL